MALDKGWEESYEAAKALPYAREGLTFNLLLSTPRLFSLQSQVLS